MRHVINFAVISVFLLSAACATRTKYVQNEGKGGYSDSMVDEKIVRSRFAGNQHTNRNDAAILSKFRAVEHCYETGLKVARIYGMNDLTTSKTVQKTSSYSYNNPTYVSGTAYSNTTGNAYGGNYNGYTNTNFNETVSGGGSNSSSKTWHETYHFPTYDTYYSCSNQAYMIKVKTKEIKAEDMKQFVQDLMGAVQIESFMADSPNKGILQVGDIVTKVNGTRVQKGPQLISEIDASPDKDNITLNIIREGKQISVTAKAIDGSDLLVADTDRAVNAACTLPEVKDRPICMGRMPANTDSGKNAGDSQ